MSVPDASEGSVATVPVRRSRTKSLASSTVASRANAAGSWLRSHNTFGSVKPSSAGLHTHSRRCVSPPARVTISRHSVVVLPSHHSSAGLITAPRLSRKTDECIWPEIPIPATRVPARRASASRIAARAASHQASGSCSAQPGSGVSSDRGAVATAATLPSRLMRMDLTLLVPMSRPRKRSAGAATYLTPNKSSMVS